ncbi:hypothetical protein ACFSTC_28755 [Nonomuraea ferruginea]
MGEGRSDRQGEHGAGLVLRGGHGHRRARRADAARLHRGRGGRPGGAPRWLRLTRAGETLTGYESADGRQWAEVAVVRLPDLPAEVEIGMFAASPGDLTVKQADLGGLIEQMRFTETTAVFDQVKVEGAAPGAWRHTDVSPTPGTNPGEVHHPGSAVESGGTFTVVGNGDIAPVGTDGGMAVELTLTGVLFALVVVVVVAVLFVTAEYRRGLVRVTLAASPRRGRVLAAKALVIGGVVFAAGLAASAVAMPVGKHLLRGNGNHVLPVPALTEVRVIAGGGRAAGRVRRAGAGARDAVQAQRGGGRHRAGADPAAARAGHRLRAARRAVAVAAAGHARRRVRRPAEHPRVSAGARLLRAAGRLLPAAAVGRAGRAVLLRRVRARPGRGEAEEEGRVNRALHAEWTKLRTVAGTGPLLLLAVVLTVAVGAALAATLTCPWGRCAQDSVKLTFSGLQASQACVALLAVLAVGGEYGTGMIGTTLTAIPRRGRVLAAKAAVVAGLTAVAGTVAVLVSALAGRLILPGRGYPALSLADGPTLRAAARLGALPRAGRAARRGDRDGRPRSGGVDRGRARAALPVPAAGAHGVGSGLAPGPVEPGADERQPRRADHRERGEPADPALGGSRRARGLVGDGAAGRRAAAAGPRRVVIRVVDRRHRLLCTAYTVLRSADGDPDVQGRRSSRAARAVRARGGGVAHRLAVGGTRSPSVTSTWSPTWTGSRTRCSSPPTGASSSAT